MSRLVTADEAEAVVVSGESLRQLASRLHDTAAPPPASSGPPFVSAEDGAGFVDLLRDVVGHYAQTAQTGDGLPARDAFCSAQEEREAFFLTMERRRLVTLRHVVLELHPGLLATLLSILQAPRFVADADALTRLFCSVLMLLQTVVLTCCLLSEQTVGARHDSCGFVEALELSATVTELLERLDAVNIVSDLLCRGYPLSVRLAAAQLLFAMMLHDGTGGFADGHARDSYVRHALSTSERLSVLLSVLTAIDTPSGAAGGGYMTGTRERGMSSHNTTLSNASTRHAATARTPEPPLLFSSLRLHVGACLRELVNTHFDSLARPEVFDVLLQLSDAEPSGDLRTMSIESLNVLLRSSSSSLWTAFPFKKELTTLCVTRIERENHHEALHATLCLLETLIVRDANSHTSGRHENDDACVCETLLALFGDRALARVIGEAATSLRRDSLGKRKKNDTDRVRSKSGAPTSSRTLRGASDSGYPHDHSRHGGLFCRGHYSVPQQRQEQQGRLAERLLCTVTSPGVGSTTYNHKTGFLAARCLRLLLQHAPYYRNGAFSIIQHLPSAFCLLETSVQLAERLGGSRENLVSSRNHNHSRTNVDGDNLDKNFTTNVDGLASILAVELAVLLSLCLAQDPRARQFFASEFCRHHAEAQEVRRVLISNLNLVSLSYFGDVGGSGVFEIFDVTGTRLNAPDGVAWDTPDRPSRVDVHNLFTAQELRWNTAPLRPSQSHVHADTGPGRARDHGNAPSGERRHSRRSVDALLQAPDDQRHQRLTFIVLSYAIHYTFGLVCADVTAALRFSAALNGAIDETRGSVPSPGEHPRYYDAYLVDAGRPTRSARQSMRTEKKVEKRETKGVEKLDEKLDEEEAQLMRQFHRSLRLFRALAQFYVERPASATGRTVVYEMTGERGMVRRQGRQEARRTIHRLLHGERDVSSPSAWEKGQQRRSLSRGVATASARAWSIKELQEKDLFYFYIPYTQLTVGALQYTRRRAEEHSCRMKKLFAITPQSARARRWMLHDLLANIMPGTIHALSQFIQWFCSHGEDKVKFAILLYVDSDSDDSERQQEQYHHHPFDPTMTKRHDDSGARAALTSSPCLLTPDTPKHEGDADLSSLPRADAVGLHAGNIIPLLGQVDFFFQRCGRIEAREENAASQGKQRTPASPAQESAGDNAQSATVPRGASTPRDARATGRKSALLRDIERQIERLQKMEFCGDEDLAELRDTLSPLHDVAATLHGDLVSPRLLDSDISDGGDDPEEGEEEFDEAKVL